MKTDLLSRRDLVEIVERASTVDERLSGEFLPAEGIHADAIDKRLQAWCQALGNGDWDRLERRLAWDGLDLDSVRPALGPVRLSDSATLPEWSTLLAEALRLAPVHKDEETDGWAADLKFLDAAKPQPFEEILAPFVLVARARLSALTATFDELLSEAAQAALEQTLLRELSFVSGEILLGEFALMRAQEQSSWERLFALALEPEGRSLYRKFVDTHGRRGVGPPAP